MSIDRGEFDKLLIFCSITLRSSIGAERVQYEEKIGVLLEEDSTIPLHIVNTIVDDVILRLNHSKSVHPSSLIDSLISILTGC